MRKIKDLFSGKKKLAGLDIGSSSLKLTEINEGSEGYTLNSYSQIPLPRGVISDGHLVQPGVLIDRLKQLLKQSRCRTKNVVTSLSGYSVIVKKIGFPSMDEASLRDLISDEVEKYLPFGDMKEVNFDFQILGGSDVNPGQMDVLLVASKKEVIESYVSAVRKAGLEVAIVDVDSFALETMYEENYDFALDDVVVLVNIGASMTNINVLKAGGSIFTRDFSMGGYTVTENLQEKLKVSFEEAERIKVEASKGNGQPDGNLREDLINCAEPLLLEVERSVDYFKSTYPGKYIKQVLLCGGGAKLAGLDRSLTERLNIDTEIVNPFKKISYDRKVFSPADIEQIGPQAAVGVGLALRRIGDK